MVLRVHWWPRRPTGACHARSEGVALPERPVSARCVRLARALACLHCRALLLAQQCCAAPAAEHLQHRCSPTELLVLGSTAGGMDGPVGEYGLLGRWHGAPGPVTCPYFRRRYTTSRLAPTVSLSRPVTGQRNRVAMDVCMCGYAIVRLVESFQGMDVRAASGWSPRDGCTAASRAAELRESEPR